MSNPKKQKTQWCIKQLLEWYDNHGRHNLPWRQPNRTVYEILIAEFMLQQTAANQVKDIYCESLNLYPTPEELSKASVNEIESVIKPLGLVYGAERMRRSAKQITQKHDGKVPSSKDDLTDLYGVGDYIALSVLIHGFKCSFGVVDTNISRIFSRVYNIEISNRPRNDDHLWKFGSASAR